MRPLVLAHGCFDPLHIGHIRYLREASKLGQALHVGVTSDEFVNKGADRPRFTASERAEAVLALGFVSEVHINEAPTAVPLIRKLQPDVYVKGADYDGSQDKALQQEIEETQACGGRFEVIKLPLLSSSRLLNGFRYSSEALTYFDRARPFLPRIEEAFKAAKSLNVVFVGETIIDEYVYVEPLSKPSKELVLATAEKGSERFQGGIEAAAAHASKLCKVKVVSQPSLAPLRKRRYVEQGFTRKLFEVYSKDKLTLSPVQRSEFLAKLTQAVAAADVVVVLDFGHGLLDSECRSILRDAKFLAVNSQSNAGNQGFNSVTKYRHADYVCVDIPELRLASQLQHGPIEDGLHLLSNLMGTDNIIVTAGREGAVWKGGTVPVLATKPVDTMGAGDCFLAFTAPLIATGLGVEEAAFVGTVAAGLKTEIVGHRQAVDSDVVLATVRSLLK